jgi:hypothetical protein
MDHVPVFPTDLFRRPTPEETVKRGLRTRPDNSSGHFIDGAAQYAVQPETSDAVIRDAKLPYGPHRIIREYTDIMTTAQHSPRQVETVESPMHDKSDFHDCRAATPEWTVHSNMDSSRSR